MIEPLFAWARSRSLVPLPFIGAVPTRAASSWMSMGAVNALGAFAGAGLPRQADLLIVVGDVSHKAAPLLQRMHLRMADPSYVLHLKPDRATGLTYAFVEDLGQILPVDVVITGDPPSGDAVQQGLDALRDVVRGSRK
jgi:NADH:ubiquinone oxidoreductase subunit B-like Fe-S oxidoreductase